MIVMGVFFTGTGSFGFGPMQKKSKGTGSSFFFLMC